jgi:tRNA threonylcarbamoyl adenosine modification protein YeaZ
MPAEPLILAFDTSAAYCAAAVLSGNRIISSHSEAMVRGQAERLMPLLHEMLSDTGVHWRDLTALGVGIGPGNFTGIRIAVSAARGLALGLDVPAVGVSGCEARARLALPGTCPAIPAPRDMVYLCDPDDPSCVPRLLPRADAEISAAANAQRLVTNDSPQSLAKAIAHIAASRWQSTIHPPAPLYARPVDAAPSKDTGPVMLD